MQDADHHPAKLLSSTPFSNDVDDLRGGLGPDNSVVEPDLDLTVDISPTNNSSKIDFYKMSNLDLGLSCGHFNLSNQYSVLHHPKGPVVTEEFLGITKKRKKV